MSRKQAPLRFERTVTIEVAWPEIDDLHVHQVTAIGPDGQLYLLDILSAVRPIKLTPRKRQ